MNLYISIDIILILNDIDAADRVKNRSEQRFPVPGEPACILCGKYGEYICDEVGLSFKILCINPSPPVSVSFLAEGFLHYHNVFF